MALPALARFGVGFLDVGPIALAGPSPQRVERHDDAGTISFPDSGAPLGLAAALPKLVEAARCGLPLLVRLAAETNDELAELVAAVSPHTVMIAVPAKLFRGVAADRPILPIVTDLRDLDHLDRAAGVIVDGSVRRDDGRMEIGATAREPSRELVKALRDRFGPTFAIVARGGVHEVEDALALRDAGADLIEVDSGFVFTGPGLAKSINEAFLYRAAKEEPEPAPVRAPKRSWFWAFLMGLGMAFGSLLALGIAATRVVLPYDEQFVGMTCAQLRELNPRLLPFMAHDRVTLAGTMIALGISYIGLALGAIRRGQHWAQVAVLNSAGLGFLTFFFFLGYGYLDALHAFVTGVLFQFLLLAVYADLGPNARPDPPPLRTDRAWRLSLWGQLLLILHSLGIAGAGAVIGGFGMTVVLVPEDLEFMRTTADALRTANPRLLPLIAHDRATLGGMLICFGVIQLLTVLWGTCANQPWLWWTLALAEWPGTRPRSRFISPSATPISATLCPHSRDWARTFPDSRCWGRTCCGRKRTSIPGRNNPRQFNGTRNQALRNPECLATDHRPGARTIGPSHFAPAEHAFNVAPARPRRNPDQ